MQNSSPRLLVSVQNASEAKVAAHAEACLIDLKNPQMGSLGRMEKMQAVECLREVRRISKSIPVSAALGELADGIGSLPEWKEFLSDSGLAFLKLGLARMRQDPDWMSRWTGFRDAVTPIKTKSGEAGENRAGWIAVAYADEQVAEAPPVDEVVAAAIATHCAGVLIDTFDKSGGGLLDHMTSATLNRIVRQIQRAGLLAVLAGKVRWDDLPTLKEIGPDVIAVRSLVCRDEDRRQEICSDAIERVKQILAS